MNNDIYAVQEATGSMVNWQERETYCNGKFFYATLLSSCCSCFKYDQMKSPDLLVMLAVNFDAAMNFSLLDTYMLSELFSHSSIFNATTDAVNGALRWPTEFVISMRKRHLCQVKLGLQNIKKTVLTTQ
jgi:hypothetical protein